MIFVKASEFLKLTLMYPTIKKTEIFFHQVGVMYEIKNGKLEPKSATLASTHHKFEILIHFVNGNTSWFETNSEEYATNPMISDEVSATMLKDVDFINLNIQNKFIDLI